MALVLLMLSGLFVNWFIAPTLSGVHKIVGARSVAMAVALLPLFQNMPGLGGGPFFTGVLIDVLVQADFARAGLGEFAAARPGVAAPAGAPAALSGACRASLADATRLGILVTVAGKTWAVLHFLPAARHVAAALGRGGERTAAQVFSPGVWWCGFEVKRLGSFCHALQIAS